jgi:hypothetical protein
MGPWFHSRRQEYRALHSIGGVTRPPTRKQRKRHRRTPGLTGWCGGAECSGEGDRDRPSGACGGAISGPGMTRWNGFSSKAEKALGSLDKPGEVYYLKIDFRPKPPPDDGDGPLPNQGHAQGLGGPNRPARSCGERPRRLAGRWGLRLEFDMLNADSHRDVAGGNPHPDSPGARIRRCLPAFRSSVPG